MTTLARLDAIEAENPVLKELHTKPPGKGKAVIYAGVCVVTDNAYVGKHAHGVHGSSVKWSRWKRHERGDGGNKPIHQAILKHGVDAIKWFVIEHVDEDDVNDRERFWISSSGLNTLANGYNRHEGGEGGTFTKEHIANITSALARQEVKEKLKKTNSTPETKKRRSDAIKEIMQRPEVKEKIKKTNSTPEVKEKRSKANKEIMARPEVKSKRKLNRELKSDEAKELESLRTKLQRSDPELEASRVAKFIATHDKNHDDEYQAALLTHILPWPGRGKIKLPKPQYYRRDGKLGFCSGVQKHFVSIEPEDRKKKIANVRVHAQNRRAAERVQG